MNITDEGVATFMNVPGTFMSIMITKELSVVELQATRSDVHPVLYRGRGVIKNLGPELSHYLN